MRAGHLAPLTSLRFFAAAAIVVYHSNQHFKLPAPSTLALGVSFFFVLSGFILAIVYGDLRQHKISEFYAARIARIWPLHVLVLLIWCVSMPLGVSSTLDLALFNAALLHAWVPLNGYPFSFNSVSWSISAEMFFYAVFPLLMRVRSFAAAYGAVAAITAIYLFGASFVETPDSPLFGTPRTAHLYLQFPLVRLLEFCTGIAAAKYFLLGGPPRFLTNNATKVEIATLLATAVLVLASTNLAVAGRNISPGFALWLSQAGLQWVFAGLIVVFAHGKGRVSRILSARPLVILGEISFAAYMFHMLIVYLAARHLSPSLNTFALYGLVLILVFGVSYVAWRGFERPARKITLRAANALINPHRRRNRRLACLR